VYATRRRMSLLVLTTNIGGQATYTSQFKNYTSFQYIAGEKLAAKFYEHLKYYGFDVKSAYTNYFSKTVTVTTGRRPREP